MRVLVTRGAGFIGSASVRHLVGDEGVQVLNVDKLTSNLASLAPIANDSRYALLQADICHSARMTAAFADFRPDGVIHLAAETHVDRSVTGSQRLVRCERNAFAAVEPSGSVEWFETSLPYSGGGEPNHSPL